MIPHSPPPGAYTVTTGAGQTPEEASRLLFPDTADVVLVDTEYHGRVVVYTFLIDYPDAVAA